MSRLVDLTGLRFGRLTVIRIRRDHPVKKGTYWECKCDCGGSAISESWSLRKGTSSSCGCFRVETSRRMILANRPEYIKHGLNETPAHIKWMAAKQRCFNPNNTKYPQYGGRGITMCDRWKNSFEAFFNDMGKCPEGLTLERINVNGNYESGNCRWASRIEQARNKTSNVWIEFNGRLMLMTDWAREFGLKNNEMHREYRVKNKSIEQISEEVGYSSFVYGKCNADHVGSCATST